MKNTHTYAHCKEIVGNLSDQNFRTQESQLRAAPGPGPLYLATLLSSYLVNRCDGCESVAPPRPLAAATTAAIDSRNSRTFAVAPFPPPLAPPRFHPTKGQSRRPAAVACTTAACCLLRVAGMARYGRTERSDWQQEDKGRVQLRFST